MKQQEEERIRERGGRENEGQRERRIELGKQKEDRVKKCEEDRLRKIIGRENERNKERRIE